MKRHHRAAMRFTAVLLFFVMIFSVLRSCADAGRDCACADDASRDCVCISCPVCIQANIQENLQRTSGIAAVVCAVASVFVLWFVSDALPEGEALVEDTPVSLKVRLLN